jgi:predicted DNA-binding transcriptional regulator AlpA
MPDRALPHWPRLMSVDIAAAYVSVSASTFRAGVESGTWPKPYRLGKLTRWDRAALDKAVDRLAGDGEPSGNSIADGIKRYGEDHAARR